MGLECTVYMGEDTRRQALNVARMKLLGAEVIPRPSAAARSRRHQRGHARLVSSVERTHYLLTVTAPSPFPTMVRYFHSVIGREAREQVLDATGRLPDAVAHARVAARTRSASSAASWTSSQLRGYEAGGHGSDRTACLDSAPALASHGARTYVMQDEWGRRTVALHQRGHGLPGSRPRHAWVHTGRPCTSR